MSNNEREIDILKKMSGYTFQMYSLYNFFDVQLLSAKDTKEEIGNRYNEMIEYKNEVNSVLKDASALRKTEREKAINQMNSLHGEQEPIEAKNTLAISNLVKKLGLKESAETFETIFVMK